MQPTLSFITLPTADLAAAIRFYAALGWAPVRAAEGYAFFQLQGLLLALLDERRWVAEGGEPFAPHGGEPAEPRRVLLSHNVDEYDNLVQLVGDWTAAGGALVRPLLPTTWGGARAMVTDPEGLRWELVWNPHAHRDARGGLWLSGPPPDRAG